MNGPWIAAGLACFLWWFSTGAILCAVLHADRGGAAARLRATLLGLPVLGLGVSGILATAAVPTVAGIYLAFLSAIAIWGWVELAFLTGIITGPNTYDLPRGVSEGERFIRAWGTIAYHEMLLLAVLLALGWATWGAANAFGFWTFAVLFFARISAKLNLFLGVPKINVEFLPSPLAHLPSHFRHQSLNWLFPLSVTALSFAVACWLERILGATTDGQIVGFALLAAMTALALLEHWFMVLPLPDEKLWRWMLPAPKTHTDKRRPEDAHGL